MNTQIAKPVPPITTGQMLWFIWCGLWSTFWLAMAFVTVGLTIPLHWLSNAAVLLVMGPQLRANRG